MILQGWYADLCVLIHYKCELAFGTKQKRKRKRLYCGQFTTEAKESVKVRDGV